MSSFVEGSGSYLDAAQSSISVRLTDGSQRCVDKAVNPDLWELLTSGMYGAVKDFVDPGPTDRDVNRERSRRVLAGATFEVGKHSIALSGDNVTRVNLDALARRASGRIDAGDKTEIVFRDAVNAQFSLTPSEVVELADAGTDWLSAIYAASFVLKDMAPIPTDYADDRHWQA